MMKHCYYKHVFRFAERMRYKSYARDARDARAKDARDARYNGLPRGSDAAKAAVLHG